MSLLSRIAVEAARGFGMLVSGSANNVPASYLVVAGGAGGGAAEGGGGGAGGYQTSTFTLSTLNTYSITVGAGGTSGAINSGGFGQNPGGDGSNSVISGTGLSTVTSTGGGGGGAGNQGPSGSNVGRNGGSGGGGNRYLSGAGGTGTSGQGNNGGAGASGVRGGGGGGASAAGASSASGSAGGAGSSSSISGSSVTYAGGGGGGAGVAGSPGAGGSGGGGAGSNSETIATSGTANLGGGGGGGGGGGTYGGPGGAGGSGVVIISYASATPRFVGGTLTTSGGNQIHTFTSSGTLSPLTPVTASYLVVAGGAGGGFQIGGGGGAGGLLASSTTLYSGATYIVTVGAGGAGDTASGGSGSNGSNSQLSGTGLTTVTSTGGGGGASNSGGTAQTGGSGGGGRGTVNGAAGTSGQGFAGGNGSTDLVTYTNAGGGGGASAVGSNATSATGGNGGTGTASSITGSSVTYAGGGGGGAQNGGSRTAGTATGGGGAGGLTGAGTSGTANTGGGGGGGGENGGTGYAGAAGGSGTVIISYAGSQVFNGGLVTSSGGNTIHTFNATGALTPLTNNLNNSLRFRGSASAYLNRTPSVASNRKTWTWSAWIKLGTISVNMGTLFGAQGQTAIYLNDGTNYSFRINGAAGSDLITNLMPRDPAAWYHLVVACDTTQATEANRLKIYVNGNQQTSFQAGSAYPTLNGDTYFNSTALHTIGRRSWNSDQQFDGYMTDINFIDGQALEPYYFGNNDANQVWKPIKYTGMYGTNGFYLTFADTSALTTSSNAGLGKDTSGNGNFFATNNISITAGVTYDAMLDVPTNTSATVANYSTLNSLIPSTLTYSEANLTVQRTTSNWEATGSTISVSQGKWYAEFVWTAGTYAIIGVEDMDLVSTWDNEYIGYSVNGRGYGWDGNIRNNASDSAYGSTFTTGDIIGVAIDMDNKFVYMSKNGVFQNSGVPTSGATGTGGLSLAGTNYIIGAAAYNATISANFGQRPFAYTPPTGFVALNTFNLPTPTILQGNKYMDAVVYNGSDGSQKIVMPAQFYPDFVWAKSRNNVTNHILMDTVRGGNVFLSSNAITAETTSSGLATFSSNGVTWTGGAAGVNASTYTYVNWAWNAGSNTTSSNTSGSITSTTSVNATAGFSIVTYTGTGTTGTVGHGLGVAPKMLILKARNQADSWLVYHSGLPTPATNTIILESTGAVQTSSLNWNSTNPTSTVFSVYNPGSGGYSNGNGYTYVAYCWAEIAGFSAFGSYTGGNNTGASTPNANGPFIYLGFRPKLVLIKRTSSAADWEIYDSSRGTYNANYPWLQPNLSNAEASTEAVDFLSNGFKIRSESGALMYPDGATFIYAAFAENPFKNANAR